MREFIRLDRIRLEVFLLISCLTDLVSAACVGAECDRFHCSSDSLLHRPVDPYLRPGAVFDMPCSCLADWNLLFCNNTQSMLSSRPEMSMELPTVCICRKFSDNGSKCHQFISRCFKRNKECSCCFNQPMNYCNHLKCRDGEPDFGGSNTTCVCHHNPADYPYQICKGLYTRDSHTRKEKLLEKKELPKKSDQPQMLTFLGLSVSTDVMKYTIVGLLVGMILLTALVLIAGNRRLRNRRDQITRQQQAAQEALLQQKAEDDRYLPSV